MVYLYLASDAWLRDFLVRFTCSLWEEPWSKHLVFGVPLLVDERCCRLCWAWRISYNLRMFLWPDCDPSSIVSSNLEANKRCANKWRPWCWWSPKRLKVLELQDYPEADKEWLYKVFPETVSEVASAQHFRLCPSNFSLLSVAVDLASDFRSIVCSQVFFFTSICLFCKCI